MWIINWTGKDPKVRYNMKMIQNMFKMYTNCC